MIVFLLYFKFYKFKLKIDVIICKTFNMFENY